MICPHSVIGTSGFTIEVGIVATRITFESETESSDTGEKLDNPDIPHAQPLSVYSRIIE